MAAAEVETYNGVPLNKLFPEEKLGWRGSVTVLAVTLNATP